MGENRHVERSASEVETSSRQAHYIDKVVSINAAFRPDPSLIAQDDGKGVGAL